ncbi:nucleotidyl cyclase domain-containing protein [Nocardiopsis kunsanensis]|uniref:GGDEF domain-containing protein n=1 Tax=Nocardiopsis kunsanensis TaxID=141693 RepID=A0A919CLW3_9ACTN|nr:GGDEF domain-containing protein [Nocardiopsis kunsanensis]GHD34512.1 hypothetical protein GCM10007147_40250 [Nocardiopsis kunsanensis]
MNTRSSHDTDPTELPAVPLFDSSQLPLRQWCAGSREDAVTGLVAFPDFHSHLPRALHTALAEGETVAVAIGDVDGLKGHVEQTNADTGSFGHLEGNRVMSLLGATTRAWFRQQPWEYGCAATFGGDEVIVAATVEGHDDFASRLGNLRDMLAERLPVTVSFGYTLITGSTLPDRRPSGWRHAFTDRVLTEVDRALFLYKASRAQDAPQGGGMTLTHLVPDSPSPQVLSALPEPGASLVVIAHPGPQPGTIALPCRGPEGLRGTRLRISAPGRRPRTELVLSQQGQAILVGARTPITGPTALRLQGVRAPSPHRLPGDLARRLDELGLDWKALPEHEQTQILNLLREARTPQVRTARLTSAVTAIRARTEHT